MGRQNNALTKKKGWGGRKKRTFEKKRKSSCLLRIWLRVDAKLQFSGKPSKRANEAVDKYLITATTNTQRAQTDKVHLMVSGCFE